MTETEDYLHFTLPALWSLDNFADWCASYERLECKKMKFLDYMKKGLQKIIDNNMIKEDIRQKASDLHKAFKVYSNGDIGLSQGTIRQLEDRLFVCPLLWPPMAHWRTIRCLVLNYSSVRLEAPMRVEYKGLDLERTFAVDTIVYILNRLFRMHQDELDVAWIEQITPDTKDHKFGGLYKVIRGTGKGQVIIIIEFSYGRKTPESKKSGDMLKLCRNAMRALNKLLKTIPKDSARVYLVQSFNGFIEIKYLVRPIPSIYILQRFMHTKLPTSFGDFEQFANDLKDLTNWQKKKAEKNQISSPRSPCPGGSPSELP
ncbi:18728_t:CDS:2 [Acaulospora morrowiae]|uniref:18728_t:CDS:1 n=1 Tax=Acaulospora morrowiae TaxID=94023 RepID=A0A9N9FVD7_9GLOM|nr:18728_t:CDS:2 [Acaulospora morrowiae]